MPKNGVNPGQRTESVDTRVDDRLKIAGIVLILVLIIEIAVWALWSKNQAVLAVIFSVVVTYIALLSRLLMGSPDALSTRMLRSIWQAIFEIRKRLVGLIIVAILAILGMLVFLAAAWHVDIFGVITFEGKEIEEPATITVQDRDKRMKIESEGANFKVSRSQFDSTVPMILSAESKHFRTKQTVSADRGNVEVKVVRRHNLIVQVKKASDSLVNTTGVEVVVQEMAPDTNPVSAWTDDFGTAYFEFPEGSRCKLKVAADRIFVSEPFVVPNAFTADISAAKPPWAEIEDPKSKDEHTGPLQIASLPLGVIRAMAKEGKPVIEVAGHDADFIRWLPSAGRLLIREGYLASYNDLFRIPTWVGYQIRGESQDVERPRAFQEDLEVPAEFRARPEDYRLSGYDRGHLVSIGDMRFVNEAAVKQAMLLSAVCPQTDALNRDVWVLAEEFGRSTVKKFGLVSVIAGPAFVAKTNGDVSVTFEMIGGARIAVPTHFFRILATVIEGQIKVLAFLVPNQVDRKDKLVKFLVPVDKIEEVTGLDFFSGLADELEEEIERAHPKELWRVTETD